jgi:hypothetical protein
MTRVDERLAIACAELILAWHQRHVFAEESKESGEIEAYRNRIQQLLELDLNEPDSQAALAREQQAGSLERYYGVETPSQLWVAVCSKHGVFDHAPPRNLGEAARWILDIIEHQRRDERPAADDRNERLSVHTGSREELLMRARSFYADVLEEEEAGRGLGGMNALVSCSLERYPLSGDSKGEVRLLGPGVLGMRVIASGERADDLVDAVRRGEIIVDDVIGGPRASDASADERGSMSR